MSYPEENIRILMPEQCVEVTEEGLYTCLICNPHPQPELLTHGRADTCSYGMLPGRRENFAELL